MIRFLLTVLLGLLNAASDAYAEDGKNWSLSAAHFQADSRNYDAQETKAGIGYYQAPRHSLSFEADMLSRRFTGGTRINDTQFGLASANRLSDHSYLESFYTHGDTANIFARWSAGTVPHYVWGQNDLAIGFRYAEYRAASAGILSPNYVRYFDGFALGLGAFVVRDSTWISAYQLQWLIKPEGRHNGRITGAAGKALEDAGLRARFNSLTGEYTYNLGTSWHISVVVNQYWSQIRNENSAGLKLEWR